METKYHRLVRLILAGRHTNTEIAEQSDISRTTVIKWSHAIKQVDPTWDAYQGKSDKELRSLIFPNAGLDLSRFFAAPSARLSERGVDVDHATLNRWVVKFSPQVAANAQARKRPTACSWRMPSRDIAVQCPAG